MPLLDRDFLARLERLEIVSRRLRRGSTRGERRSLRRGSSVEFADHRPYGAGSQMSGDCHDTLHPRQAMFRKVSVYFSICFQEVF